MSKRSQSVIVIPTLIQLTHGAIMDLCVARARKIVEARRAPNGMLFLNAITQAMCTSYKEEILQGVHLAADTYNIALYTSAATLSAATTAYSATNEVANGNGYTTGGQALVGFAHSSSGTTAWIDWTTDPSWATASFTARGALIYNTTRSNKAVAVLDFGADKTATAGTFLVTLPTADATNSLIRIV